MNMLTKEQQTTIAFLERIIQEKRLAFLEVDHQLFGPKNDDSSLLPKYTLAKRELRQAVDRCESYLASLTSSYICNTRHRQVQAYYARAQETEMIY